MPFQSTKPAATVHRFPGAAAGTALTAAPLLPVLVVLHQETSTPGRVGNALRALGHPLVSRKSGKNMRTGGCAPTARRWN